VGDKAKKAASGTRDPLKIGVLISGSGTNLQAIIDEIAAGKVNAQIVLVLSSRPDAYGLQRAEAAGIPTVAFNRDVYADAHAANQRIADEMRAAGAEYLFMAGYMRMVGAEVLDAYPDRVVNLHPALLPKHKGAHGIQDAFEAGDEITGITIHLANQDYDEGPIIYQHEVPILPDDTLETLEERIHAVEHESYPYVLQKIAEGKVQLRGKRATIIE
jgi:phosphoribosylglycinamide formyltransferase-1